MSTTTYICRVVKYDGSTIPEPHLVTQDPQLLLNHQRRIRFSLCGEIHILDRKIEDDNGNVTYPDSVGMMLKEANIDAGSNIVTWKPRGRNL